MFDTPEVLNPFPGLRPFEIEETNLFFGRDGQSDALLERLRRTRFLAVVGTSGSGKSSLIRAGLLPALYGGLMGGAGSNWRIAILRPGHDPIGNLAWALGGPDVFGAGEPSEIQNTLIETTLRRGSLGLVDAAQQGRMEAHENLLVVVDQFEELFRFKDARKGHGSEEDPAAFVKLLLAAVRGELPIYVVLTMRSDFLGDCAQFLGLPEAINDGQYLIPRMSRDERRAAITGPVAVAGAAISLPLVGRLLNDVGDNPDQLPILQHALMRTWDYRAAHRRNGEPLGLEHYEAIGTMSEALSLHADEAFAELPNEGARSIAERMFKRLTEKGADNREIRRPTPLVEICGITEAAEDEVVAVINVFRQPGRSFLMPAAGAALEGETVIDISHESLIRNWKRLQKWVDEESQSARVYRRLAEAAVLHREGHESLLQDPALQIALDWYEKNRPNTAWAARYHQEFDRSVLYLEASRRARDVAAAERERHHAAELERERREREQAELYAAGQARAARRLRWLAIGMALMFLLALATAAFAMKARSSALRAQGAALEAQTKAEVSLKDLQIAQKELAQSAADQAKANRALRITEGNLQKEAVRADIARRKALETARIANEEKIKAEKARNDFQKEATRNAKARKANDDFREAALYVQRGKYQDAKDYFSSAIEQYEDPDVNSPEAIADATVEIGNLALSVARNSFARSGDLRLNNIMGNLQKSIGEYDQAAKIYSGSKVKAREKAAATNFSLAMSLLPFTNQSAVPRPSNQNAEASPGWNGAEGEVPYLSIRQQPLSGDSFTEVGSDSIQKLNTTIVEHLSASLSDYRTVFNENKNKTQGRAEVAREGMRKAAYQLGEFHLKEANRLESATPYSPFGEKVTASGDAKRREASRYFEELLSSFEVNDLERGRLLIWLGGLNLSLGHGTFNEDRQAAEKYFDRVLKAFAEIKWTEGEALAFVADRLKENEQLPEAVDFYHRAAQAYASKGDPGREADMYVDRGQVYERMSLAARAGDCYSYALGRYQQVQDPTQTQVGPERLVAVGSFYKASGNEGLALQGFDLAIKFGERFKRDDIEIYQARAYSEKGSILALQRKAAEALDAYKQAVMIYEKLAAAPVGYNGSKEQASTELERLQFIVKTIDNGPAEGGSKKP